MLDIEKLKIQFNEIRASLTTNDLQEWLYFAEQRELEDKLERGETVLLQYNEFLIVDIENIIIKKSSQINSKDKDIAIAA